MKHFALLVEQLYSANNSEEKSRIIAEYLSLAGDRDKLWMIFLLSGGRIRKSFSVHEFREWVIKSAEIPEWLFDEAHEFVGDLSETASLLIGKHNASTRCSLSQCIEILLSSKQFGKEDIRISLAEIWNEMNSKEAFAFFRIITGSLRFGITARNVITAISKHEACDVCEVAYRLSQDWEPAVNTYDELIRSSIPGGNPSAPYPFKLLNSKDQEFIKSGNKSEWLAEWMLDGIRAQIVRRRGECFIWTKEFDLITTKFPEIVEEAHQLPDGIVLDGIIVSSKGGMDSDESILKRRFRRKNLTLNILSESPAVFAAHDVIEFKDKDIRRKSLRERRSILMDLLETISFSNLRLSKEIRFRNPDHLKSILIEAGQRTVKGIVLKKWSSQYGYSETCDDWLELKSNPMTVDAVLTYSKSVAGMNSDGGTELSFSLWDNGSLVSVATATADLAERELSEIVQFVKSNTVERYGPVSLVKPELVFEIAFEGVIESKRRKSGIVLKSPRVLRILNEKSASEAGNLQDVRNLLKGIR